MFFVKLKAVCYKVFNCEIKHIRSLATPKNIFNTKLLPIRKLLNVFKDSKSINFNIFNSNLNSLKNGVLLYKMPSKCRLDTKFHYRIGNYG